MAAPKQVIVVRKDLKMRRGKECAQVAHASMKVFADNFSLLPRGQENAPGLWFEIDKATAEWFEGRFTKICLSVNSEAELMAVYEAAVAAGVKTALVVDAGQTEFHGIPTPTCVAVGPDYPEKIDPITGGLTLY